MKITILSQIQTFYRPETAKKSVLQTQVCKYRPTWEPCSIQHLKRDIIYQKLLIFSLGGSSLKPKTWTVAYALK